MFLEGRGLNSSYAVYQDATGKAFDKTIALGDVYKRQVFYCFH